MKNKSTIAFIATLTIIAALLGYNYFKQPFLKTFQEQDQIEPEAAPQDSEADLPEFSAEEKISQLIVYPLTIDQDLLTSKKQDATSSTLTETGENSEPDAESDQQWNELKAFQPGIIAFFGENISTSSAQLASVKISEIFADDALRPLLAVDHEGGQVQRFSGEGFTKLPSFKEMCTSHQEDAEEMFSASAKEVSQAGIHIVFAPVVDIAASHPVLGSRICSNSEQTRQMAEFYIRAFSQYRVMPVLKHFPGIGNTQRDLHDYSETIELDPLDGEVFRDLLDKYPNIGVMSTHVKLEDKLNNLPCSMSSQCLAFSEFYPEATIFADSLDMESAQLTSAELSTSEKNSTQSAQIENKSASIAASVNQEGQEKNQLSLRAEQALRAGNHFLIFGKGVSTEDLNQVKQDLVSLYQSDSGFKSVVDQRFERVLALKAIKN